jgi:protoporphyrin/coproporphyrin ferrochelatase
MTERRGVLVMAYGTADGLEDVERYYTDIRGGRRPSPEALAELTDRYRAIGGSPLLDITRSQALGLEHRLGIKSYLGQKHASPTISEAVDQMAADRVERAVGLVLAPHYSKMSIGDYESRVRRAAEGKWTGTLEMVRSWHTESGYIEFLSGAVHRALDRLSDGVREEAVVIFSAHSLPARILQAHDPYPDQLQETADGVARRAGLERWQIGWQSAGSTNDPWLGPDVTEILSELASKNVPGAVVCACGFVAEHLEVLYDLDIEAKARADELRLELARTNMPNDDPLFLDTLADVVARRFAEKS